MRLNLSLSIGLIFSLAALTPFNQARAAQQNNPSTEAGLATATAGEDSLAAADPVAPGPPTPAATGGAPKVAPAPKTPPPSNQSISPAASGQGDLANQLASEGPIFVPEMIGYQGPVAIKYLRFGRNDGTVPIAGGAPGFQMAEDDSPLPVDRVFFDYNHFQNAVTAHSGGNAGALAWFNVERFDFGVEKTFWDGWASIEMRIPFAGGLPATQSIGGPETGVVFGNIPIIYKNLIVRREDYAFSGGLAVIVPTAPDAVFANPLPGPELDRITNTAIHLQPFLGFVWTPGDWFIQGFAQMDFDVSGDSVIVLGVTGPKYYAQSLAMFDLSIGKWIYKSQDGWVTGIAPTIELHNTSTMQPANTTGAVGQSFAQSDFLDLTAGVHLKMGTSSDLTVAASVPLNGTDISGPVIDKQNREFDAEIIVQFNRRF